VRAFRPNGIAGIVQDFCRIVHLSLSALAENRAPKSKNGAAPAKNHMCDETVR
jgi:hypothetical protein